MVGEILREKRISLDRDIREAAEFLKIRHEYLKALEEDNFSKLPPPVYTRGYIREYARFLGLEPGPLLEAYGKSQSSASCKIEPIPTRLPHDKKPYTLPKSALFLATIAVVAVVVIALIMDSPKRYKTMEMPLQFPKTEKEQLNTILSGQHTLEVTATETTWLRVETEEGKAEEALMRQGETKKFVSRDGFELRIGNAGGVRISLDGKDLGSPGNRGQVVTLKLPEGSLAQPAAAPN